MDFWSIFGDIHLVWDCVITSELSSLFNSLTEFSFSVFFFLVLLLAACVIYLAHFKNCVSIFTRQE